MVALAHSGVAFGGSANFILSGLVAEIWGWEAVFYVTGTLVLISKFIAQAGEMGANIL